MNLKIKRRRFAQLALASFTTTAIANLSNKKTLAKSSESLIGVRLPSNQSKQSKQDSTDLENTTPAITLVSLNVTTGGETSTTEIPSITVDNQETKVEAANKAIYKEPKQRITGITTLSDGTLVTVTVTTNRKGNFSKLLLTDQKSSQKTKSKKISGFKKSNNTIEGIIATQNDKIIAIASYNEGVPPFYLLVINPKNGKVITDDNELALPDLPINVRFSNITLDPNGKFYATILTHESRTTLIQLDPAKKSLITGKLLINQVAELTYNNEYLQQDLLGLTFSQSGQLIALGNINNESINSLFSVNVKSGEMTFLSKVTVDKIVFSRS